MIRGRYYVSNLQYFLAWRTSVELTSDMMEALDDIFKRIARDNGVMLFEVQYLPEGVGLGIECSPQHYIPDLVKAFKGVSARLLLKELPGCFTGRLWLSGYYVSVFSDGLPFALAHLH